MGKRRLGLGAGVFSIFLFIYFVAVAYAIPITITATGDNYIYYYDWVNQSWQKLDDADYDSWKVPAQVSLEWDNGYGYLVFAVKNRGTGSSGNPAGLLAEVEVSNWGSVLSGESWEVFGISGGWTGLPNFDVWDYLSCSDWVGASWYASNSGEINPNYPQADGIDTDLVAFWYEENGNQGISGIDLQARWIWTDRNFSADMDKGALFRVRVPQPNKIPDPVVPEPTGLSLFLLGGILGLVRKRS